MCYKSIKYKLNIIHGFDVKLQKRPLFTTNSILCIWFLKIKLNWTMFYYKLISEYRWNYYLRQTKISRFRYCKRYTIFNWKPLKVYFELSFFKPAKKTFCLRKVHIKIFTRNPYFRKSQITYHSLTWTPCTSVSMVLTGVYSVEVISSTTCISDEESIKYFKMNHSVLW